MAGIIVAIDFASVTQGLNSNTVIPPKNSAAPNALSPIGKGTIPKNIAMNDAKHATAVIAKANSIINIVNTIDHSTM